jgi:hypothetical protein
MVVLAEDCETTMIAAESDWYILHLPYARPIDINSQLWISLWNCAKVFPGKRSKNSAGGTNIYPFYPRILCRRFYSAETRKPAISLQLLRGRQFPPLGKMGQKLPYSARIVHFQ